MSDPILQSRLPFLPWMDPRTQRLPGIVPVEGDDWLRIDDAFAGQMAERDRLIANQLPAVHALLPGAEAAAAELYARVLAKLAAEESYRIGAHSVLRPDGIEVPLDESQPMITLGHLVQEDLCLMQAEAGEHRLTGAILCFPAGWTLSEKLGRPMTSIHTPVAPYTEDVARRVQRLFDAIRPEQPLWRMNFLNYDNPSLHQPRREGEVRPRPVEQSYIRCERQCLIRLPETRAVVFSIHTYLVRAETLTETEMAAFKAALH
jgi:dimethylamine monooxygenase subunit A